MIQEGTSFLKPEANLSADDQSWVEQLVENSFFKFFPHLQDQILELGQISNFPAGHKFFKADDKMQSIFVPLNKPLSLRFTSGRFGEEKIFSNIKPFHTIGCREAINGSIFPFAIEVEEPTFVFSIAKEDLLVCFKNLEDLKILDLICSSQSLFSFSSWLLNEETPLASIRKILLSIKEKNTFEKLKEMRIKKVALFLIENGSVQITKKMGEDEIYVFLETGDWFGGSLLPAEADLKLDFHVVDDLSVQLIDFETIKIFLKNETFKLLCQEPCIQKEILKTQDFNLSNHLFNTDCEVHEIGNLSNFGFRFAAKNLHFSNDLSQWAYATIWNSFLMLDFEINERQAQALSVGKSVMSFGTYAQLFEDLGFLTKIVRFQLDQWPPITVPHLAVIHGRPCLIVANQKHRIWVLDPKLRLISYSVKDIFKIWNRVALKISRPHAQLALSHDLKSLNAKPEVTGKILLNYFLNQSKGELLNLSIFKFFQAIAVLFIPGYLLGLVNQVVTYKRVDFLTVYYTGLGIFVIFQMFALYYSAIYTNQVLMNFKSKAQPYFYKLFLSQPNSFVTSVKAGFIQSRLSLIDFALSGLKAFRIDLVQSLISLSLFIIIVGFYSWQAAIVLLLFIAGGLGHAYLLREAGSLDIINTAQQRQEVTDLGLSFLTGFDSIKSTRSEKWAKATFEKIFIALLKGSKKYNANIIRQTQIGTIIFQIGSVVTLYVVISELLYTQAPPQNALALSMYLSYCQGPYSSLLNLLVSYKISGVIGIPGQLVKNEVKENISTMKVVSLKGGVQLDRVSARYGDRGPFTVQDVSFSVQPREVVAIVGRSGSGKTTLGRILSRQMELQGGRLMFDEIDVRTIDSSCIQSNIGFVSQTPTLFSGTIAQNIAISDDILDEKLIKEAAIAANAHNFIEKLPGKYNYILREEGKGLSLGQRQQIALARVLYSRPKILILDEATAHLDPMAEKLISDRLFDFHKGQTVFVIVQRISTARKADKIVVMKNGRVVEVGDHNRLLAMNGEYAELFRHQIGAD